MSDRVTMNPYMASDVVDLESPDDIKLADKMKSGREQILRELRKVIIGQEEVINQVLNTLFVGGNSLIVGAPGLAKTLLIHTMAQVLQLKFSRIQFTPDLMPSDIQDPKLERPVSGEDLIEFQKLVRKVPVAEPVMRHALDIVRATRPRGKDSPDFVNKWIAFGASVRAAQYLVLGGKARALTSG